MNWKNLKLNRCPGCGKTFGALNFTKPGYVECINSMSNCNFIISEKRYMEIVSSQITADLEKKWTDELKGGEQQ